MSSLELDIDLLECVLGLPFERDKAVISRYQPEYQGYSDDKGDNHENHYRWSSIKFGIIGHPGKYAVRPQHGYYHKKTIKKYSVI